VTPIAESGAEVTSLVTKLNHWDIEGPVRAILEPDQIAASG
jgi:hypothetical protein